MEVKYYDHEKIYEMALIRVFNEFPEEWGWRDCYQHLVVVVQEDKDVSRLVPHCTYSDYSWSELLATVESHLDILRELLFWLDLK